MNAHGPAPWLLLGLVIALVLGGARRGLFRLGGGGRFFDGMNRITVFALSGAMLLALSLLVDVYGTQQGLGLDPEGVSLALAGAGATLVLLSIVFERRSKNGPH